MKRPVKIADLGVLTTGQVGRICEFSPKTVCRWIDDGRLAGWRVPGTKDRRVMATDLVSFLEAHGMDHALRMYRQSQSGIPPRGEEEAPPAVVSRASDGRSARTRVEPKELPDSGFVYFVQASEGSAIKIGFSYDPTRRMKQFQEGSPTPIRCLGIMFGGRRLERRLHQDFAAMQVSGEWFEADPALLRYVAANSIPLAAIAEDDSPCE